MTNVDQTKFLSFFSFGSGWRVQGIRVESSGNSIWREEPGEVLFVIKTSSTNKYKISCFHGKLVAVIVDSSL